MSLSTVLLPLSELRDNLKTALVSSEHYRKTLINQSKTTEKITKRIIKIEEQIRALDYAITTLKN